MSTPQTWLTLEAADRLRGELAHLESGGRKEITAKIEAARAEGDLKENGGYHAARDEQGKMEARIRYDLDYLRNWSLWLDMWIILRTAQVVAKRENAH